MLRDFRWAIIIMAVLALGPVVDSLSLTHDAGSGTSGHQPPPEVESALV
jgi:hypothetical protein